MTGEKNLTKLLSMMTPSLADQTYVFVCVPDSMISEFSSFKAIGCFKEQEGLTLIVPEKIAQHHGLEYFAVFKCITLNVHSSLEAVGLTAAVAQQLAEHDISANVIAAFYHDHIFVPVAYATKALAALMALTK